MLANPKIVVLMPLLSCSQKQQIDLLSIRNQDKVRSMMFTSREISLKEHLFWLSQLAADLRTTVLVILDAAGSVLGAISLVQSGSSKSECNWGMYIDTSLHGLGLGATVEYHLVKHVFSDTDIEKLTCEVISGNSLVLELHNKFGFENNGFRLEKDPSTGDTRRVHQLVLRREAWLRTESSFSKKYQRVFDKYNLSWRLDSAPST